jgi:DNA-directed RNA polymerase subunit F
MLSEVSVKRVSGVVVTYRSRPLLTKIIKNLKHFSSFVVVDNSTDSSQSVVAELSKILPQGIYLENI